jgi:hypothetical protein
MLEKNEQCNQATINPKTQAIVLHTFINVVFKYILQVKDYKMIINTNASVFDHIKIY